VQKDGVRVTVTVDENPLHAGKPTWLTATVTNIGRDVLVWFHDGCAIPVSVFGQLAGAQWRPGTAQQGELERFKDYAVGHSGDLGIRIYFTPEAYIGKGGIGCADVGIADRIAPGGKITRRLQWNGQAYVQDGPPPSGPVRLLATFEYYWRASKGEPANITDQKITVPIDAWVVDGRIDLLDPPEIVDAALAAPAFADFIRARQVGNASEPVLRFDSATGLWTVGLIEYAGSVSRLHYALVEPQTGQVQAIGDRDWDFKIDGNP
jgi:hypothetical protein